MRDCLIAALSCLLVAACGGSDTGAPVAPESEAVPEAAAPGAGDNRVPVIDSIHFEPPEPSVDDVLRVVVRARDADGDHISLGYRWFADGRDLVVGDPQLALDEFSKGTRIAVQVTAGDGRLESEAAHAEVTLIDRPPTLSGVALSPKESVPPGEPVKALAVASDPDGDSVDYEYRWSVNGRPVDAEDSVFSTEGLRKDDVIRVEVRATDGNSWTRPKTSAGVVVGSAYPKITSRPPGFREGGVFRYQVAAEDPDGDRRLRYRLDEAPEGMVIDDIRGEITWQPREGQVGVHPVAVVVRDSTGLETKQSFEVTVQEGGASQPPASDH